MDTILEQMRSLYEERDRIELAVVNEMNSKKAGHKEKLHSEHRQNALIERYMRCSKKLLALHEDQAKKPPEEPKDMDAVFEEFYREVKKIKDYYATHPEKNVPVYTLADEFEDIEASRQMVCNPKPSTSIQEPENLEDDAPDKDGEIDRLTRGLPAKDLVEIVQPTTAPARTEPLIQFTDEEGNGRYLDLHHCYNAFLQVIKHEENKPRYLEYLNSFDQFENLDRKLKLTSQYNTYLNELLNYFRDYSRRAKPLLDCEEMESKTENDFTSRWASKCVPGWFQESDREAAKGAEMIDLNIYRSAEELMELGLECLKNDLQARGLKCGGTLEERARRLWSVKGKSPHEIDDSLKAGTKKGKKRGIDPMKIALLEAKIFIYTDLYTDHRQATIENVQRKQARTAEERDESDEDISDIDEDDNDEGDVIYNPKNLPLGWDGKPIPYWLYKLHGLNITFTCEICGNATYKGPKTFQRHFAEWRHAHGMRCLGIPNTAHFANITKIEDAINLWDKLKNERQKEKFQPQNEEEFEDSLGNVVNKKTYEDLKRQGLL